MTGTIGWLTASSADVPPGDDWLGSREREVLGGLRVAKRREDWRLGRWTLKRALGAGVEVLAAADGAPEAWLGDTRAPCSISLSHRAGRALAVVADAGVALGCDLEKTERRSDAFVREWLADSEQALVLSCGEEERALAANRAWTAKEAAAKARREGLRLDVRNAVSVLGDEVGGWGALHVAWPDGVTSCGWWRAQPGWVMTVVSDPPLPAPRALPPRA